VTLFAPLVGDRAVLRVGGHVFTAEAVAERIGWHLARVAHLPPGARVAVVTAPDPWTPLVLAAHALAGLVSVPLNPALGERELAHVLADAAPVLVVGGPGGPPLAAPPATPPPVRSRAVDDAPLLVVYTSGTTGPPKGAVLTARNVAACLDALGAVWGWTAADTVVHALPLFHVHGLVLGWFGPLRRGGALCWVPRFDPEAVDAALVSVDSALSFSVPTQLHRLSLAPSVAGLRRARLVISGSAPLPGPDRARVRERAGREVLERYGLTETLIVTAEGPHDAASTVGRPLAGVELRRHDVQDGVGEVWVRGDTLFAGYLNRPPAVDADGWFRTGDLATVDDVGRLRIVGRMATDLVKTGGFKVGAGEVEDALLSHPDVAEAAVVGRPDADLGERLVAFVVRRGDIAADALVDHVARALAPHKRPREVRFVDSLPRNAMGKLQKGRLP
jgi:malonyl-CoA/methylmalonyl-CoA synthetase